MDNVYAVIMAGGVGARFWPLSRRATPKQLLPIGPTDAPLLAETVRRIEPIVPAERVLVVTNASLKEATAHAVPRLVPGNILAEPAGRNTAPCIAWAAARVARTDPSAVLVVLPADHHIGDEPAYRAVLDRAVEAARDGALVTVGLEPTRPETGYGYIETGAETSPGVRRVARFVEKPDAARADAFLKAGNFLWNSGMFFF
ncbi:MAG: mannose-1-phosphate guanylyltransferase, partial [Myxococcales bacterium]|nr:mannose-1-phosphate guanylyltransferase [Myxococcales bacterium]